LRIPLPAPLARVMLTSCKITAATTEPSWRKTRWRSSAASIGRETRILRRFLDTASAEASFRVQAADDRSPGNSARASRPRRRLPAPATTPARWPAAWAPAAWSSASTTPRHDRRRPAATADAGLPVEFPRRRRAAPALRRGQLRRLPGRPQSHAVPIPRSVGGDAARDAAGRTCRRLRVDFQLSRSRPTTRVGRKVIESWCDGFRNGWLGRYVPGCCRSWSEGCHRCAAHADADAGRWPRS